MRAVSIRAAVQRRAVRVQSVTPAQDRRKVKGPYRGSGRGRGEAGAPGGRLRLYTGSIPCNASVLQLHDGNIHLDPRFPIVTALQLQHSTFGPVPNPPRDGDKKQARQRINVLVRTGRLAHPNDLPCRDCGHAWKPGERRHEYDHHRGYAAAHHYDVEPVCTTCHAKRDSSRKAQTHCVHGHAFDEANTITAPNGTRHCRECRRAHDRSRGRDAAFWRNYREMRRGR